MTGGPINGVRSIKSSTLDANLIACQMARASGQSEQGDEEGNQILEKRGLERLSPEWLAMFSRAMDYWLPRGGFK